MSVISDFVFTTFDFDELDDPDLAAEAYFFVEALYPDVFSGDFILVDLEPPPDLRPEPLR